MQLFNAKILKRLTFAVFLITALIDATLACVLLVRNGVALTVQSMLLIYGLFVAEALALWWTGKSVLGRVFRYLHDNLWNAPIFWQKPLRWSSR